MTEEPPTRQRLLELVYDLLPEAEAAELRRRIDADPELGRAYAEAQRTAELFASASRVRLPKIELRRPEEATTTSAGSAIPQAALEGGAPMRGPWARWANWAVGLAAAILLMVPVGLSIYHRDQLREIAADHLRLRITGPARLQAGIPADYSVTTSAITGDPVPAEIQFVVYSSDDAQLFGHNEAADANGHLSVSLSTDKPLPAGAVLKVVAQHGGARQEVETRLAVEPVRYGAELALDKPLYRPGETIHYRSLTLSRFALAADRESPIEFCILGPDGAAVPDSTLQGVTERGVGNGSFAIPAELPGGEYTLAVRSLDGSFPEQKRPLFIRRYRLPRLKKELEFARDSYAPGDAVVADFLAERAEGGPAAGAQLKITARVDEKPVFDKQAQADDVGAFQVRFDLPKQIQRGDAELIVVVDDGGNRESIVKTIPIHLGKVEVDFYPEGGNLAAGLENRVYFTARDPLGEPVHIEGIVVDGKGQGIVGLETTHEGMGSFSFIPAAAERYRLKITSPPEMTLQPELPEVDAAQNIVLSTGSGVFASSKPLEFNIRTAKAGVPLVVAAYCRGTPVGQQALVTKLGGGKDRGTNSVVIPVPDAVGGVIRLTVYDYGASPPQPVSERLVYRRMGQRLNLDVAEDGRRYAPGERVDTSLRVTDEKGEPVAEAVLGVAVVDDALLNLADDDTASMPTHFLLTTEVEKPEDLEDADFYLSDDPEAAVALDLLLGTQGWRRFVEKTLQELQDEGQDDEQLTRLVAMGGPSDPPAVFDNLGSIQSKYEQSLDDYWAEQTKALNTLTTVSFFGGLGLVLLVAMLGLLKVVSGVHLWVPALGVTACCLVIGVILMDPARLTSRPNGAVAFAPFHIEPPEAPDEAVKHKRLLDRDGDQGLTVEWLRAHGLVDGRGEAHRWDINALAEFDDFARVPIAPGDEMILGLPQVELQVRMGKEEGRELFMLKRLREKLPDGAVEGEELEREAKRLGLHWIEASHIPRPLAGGAITHLDAEVWAELDKRRAEFHKRFRFTVRQYAHVHSKSDSGQRADFAETLFWHPLLVTDNDGRANVSFDLCDSITTFRVRADAHGGGRIGSGGGEVISRIPFNLEPKLPLEVTAGDRIDVPLAVVSDTEVALPVELTLEHSDLEPSDLEHSDLVTLDGSPQRKLQLGPGQRSREYFTLEVTGQKGDCRLVFRGTALRQTGGNLTDAVARVLKVVPPGFPKRTSYSGQIDGQREVVVELPEAWVPGSLEVTLNAFPSTLADLQQGMDSMLQEPNGCFEQASTSNYPNVLSLQYMEEHDVANPAVTRRAKDLLKKGYAKLVGYECSKKGYEWFGGDPGHEALTAYGLMEFRDMAKVYDVDREMLQRTADWLIQRRDGRGGFQRNAKALDSFGRAPDEISNAYITWALAESGQEGIEAEIRHVAELALKSEDPYLVALAAASSAASSAGNSAANSADGDQKQKARQLMDKLAGAQAEDGHLEGTQGSITRSGGHSLKVETTALAALAWLKLPDYAAQADRAVRWIINSRQGSGGFGSTQATILALKALVEHSRANRRTLAAGKLIVRRDDLTIGEHAFGAGQQETIVIDGLEANLQPGENRLTINLTGENQMPYALDVGLRTRKPLSDENCPVRLSTKLAGSTVKVGETVALTAEVTNATDEGQPMTIAILGLPAGLEARVDQLEKLKKIGTIDYYETRAREVICYWRSMAPKKKHTVKLDLVAAVPGKYTGPASRTYLYYTAEQKQWAEELDIEITR